MPPTKGPTASQDEKVVPADRISEDLIMKKRKHFDHMDQRQDRRFTEMDQHFKDWA